MCFGSQKSSTHFIWLFIPVSGNNVANIDRVITIHGIRNAVHFHGRTWARHIFPNSNFNLRVTASFSWVKRRRMCRSLETRESGVYRSMNNYIVMGSESSRQQAVEGAKLKFIIFIPLMIFRSFLSCEELLESFIVDEFSPELSNVHYNIL